MPFGWIAAATIGSGLLQADAAKSAASTQANAANNATATNLQMFNTINQQQAPYRQGGQSGLNALLLGSGLPGVPIDNGGYWSRPGPDASNDFWVANAPTQPQGAEGVPSNYFTRQFGANDLKSNLAPNYEFMKGQGIGATSNLLNTQGGIAGNTLKGVTDYAENYASNAYQNAFSNFNVNQTNIYNRLASIAGLGQTANAQTAQAGVPIAGAIGNAQMAAGASQAAGTVGATNAITGAANNAASWYSLPAIMNYGRNPVNPEMAV